MDILLFVLILIAVIINLAVTILKFKKIDITQALIDKIDIQSIDVNTLFHPEVVKVYEEFKADPDSWVLKHNHTITNGKLEIWASNDIFSREFHGFRNWEVNLQLKYIDKQLLDKICKAVKARQQVVLTKVF